MVGFSSRQLSAYQDYSTPFYSPGAVVGVVTGDGGLNFAVSHYSLLVNTVRISYGWSGLDNTNESLSIVLKFAVAGLLMALLLLLAGRSIPKTCPTIQSSRTGSTSVTTLAGSSTVRILFVTHVFTFPQTCIPGINLVLYAETMYIYISQGRNQRSARFFMSFSTSSLILITIFVALQSILGEETWIVNANYPGGSAAYSRTIESVWWQTMATTSAIALQLLSDGLWVSTSHGIRWHYKQA